MSDLNIYNTEELAELRYNAEVAGDFERITQIDQELAQRTKGSPQGAPLADETAPISTLSESAVLRDVRKLLAILVWVALTGVITSVVAGGNLAGQMAAVGARYSFQADDLYWSAFNSVIWPFVACAVVAAGIVWVLLAAKD